MVIANRTRPAICPPSAEVIRHHLRQSPFAAVRRLSVDLSNGVLVLHGRVPTFYTKQVALKLASEITGFSIVDEIEVALV